MRQAKHLPTDIGKYAEQKAARFLSDLGYQILAQNFHFNHAEIDIIAKDQNQIVFVEVKYRRSTAFGYPEQWITKAKISLLYRAAEAWLYKRYKKNPPACRFDLISCTAKKREGNSPELNIKHYKHAFRLE